MNTFQIVVTAVLATLVAVLLAAVATASLAPRFAVAHVAQAALGHPGHCRRFEGHDVQAAGDRLTAALNLSDSQQATLAPVLQVVDRWHTDMVTTCEAIDLSTAAAGLEALEQVLAQTTAAVGELRPAFADFHASLDDAQRDQVDSWASRPHKHGGRGRHGWHR